MAIRRSLSTYSIHRKRSRASVRSLYIGSSRTLLSEMVPDEPDPHEIVLNVRQEDYDYDPNDGSGDSTRTRRFKIRERTKAAWVAFKIKLRLAKL
jgi:hypothetical protein